MLWPQCMFIYDLQTKRKPLMRTAGFQNVTCRNIV